jgi:D-sedoheptulose 7-phosphate isomerase
VIDRIADDMVGEIERLVTVVLDTLGSGGTLFFCGNGGSAADAQHLAAEFVVRLSRDREAMAALALTTDTSVLTASGNDLGFAHVFERQVRALGRRGDLLVLLSTSGMSENLELAADAARQVGMRTVALLAKGGGRLRDRVDFALVVPTDSTTRAQEAHGLIGHLVCEAVDGACGGGEKGKGWGPSGRAPVPDPPEA